MPHVETDSMAEPKAETDKGKEERMKQMLEREEHLISGWESHEKQTETIFLFWETIWPALQKDGWTKIDGTGPNTGSIQFYPSGAEYSYDRIRSVIDRLLERRNAAESAIAEAHLIPMECFVGKKKGPGPSIARPRRRAVPKPKRESSGTSMLDLSWKNGGREYPKHASNIGPDYQVDSIPLAGTYQDQKEISDTYCELVWDPAKAKAKGISLEEDEEANEEIIGRQPYNKKEAALLLLAERDYSLDGFDDAVRKIKPIDGSDWSEEKKKRFHSELFRLRKDLLAVSKLMDIEMKSCLAYYLGTFKKSDDYRLLKTVCAEKRNDRIDSSDYGVDACATCGDGGSLLICDGCEGEYHMGCLRPPLETVPEGKWECDKCVDIQFLAARDHLLRNTKLFQRKGSKKRSIDDMTDEQEEESENFELVPTEAALEAVRQLANSISAALSRDKFEKPTLVKRDSS